MSDISDALKLLTEAAAGKGFPSLGDGTLRPVSKVQICAECTVAGEEKYDVTVYALDHDNATLCHWAPTLDAAVSRAIDAIDGLPVFAPADGEQ